MTDVAWVVLIVVGGGLVLTTFIVDFGAACVGWGVSALLTWALWTVTR